ncbi:unnamed protein product [Brachionus calyciflorus]|uniref:KAT8 regulatory NSL complex subunit 2 n=1 Tax=Brachionus calyciflorus TaxID=104777 RepID=A0A813Q6M8_9BILA|nr:unnamed protein product [Brachionus calyciflorus]
MKKQVFFQNLFDNFTNETPNLCIFNGCNLKSIKNYDFCYQHVDLFVKKTCNKYSICKWKDETNSKKCNQLVKKDLNKKIGKNNSNEFCITHSALEKLKIKKSEGEFLENNLIVWKEDKQFNEIEYFLSRRDVQDLELSDNENNHKNFIDLIDIDSDPQILRSSNDPSDKLLLEIIEKYSIPNSSKEQTIESNTNTTPKKNSIPIEVDINKKSVYTKEELVKIYNLKLSKLKLMYKKQINILNDKLIIDRKKYLTMKKNSEQNINPSYSGYIPTYKDLNQQESYLKRKYDPITAAKTGSSIYKHIESNRENSQKCSYNPNGSICDHICLPQSKFCKNHITSDQNQYGFCDCNFLAHNALKHPLIKQVAHTCEKDFIQDRSMTNEFSNIIQGDIIPDHLVKIYKNFTELKKSDNQTDNVFKDDSKISKNFEIFSKSEDENQNDLENIEGKESASTLSSSSSDSSFSTTSSDSNKSVLSSSISSSTDSDEEQDQMQLGN